MSFFDQIVDLGQKATASTETFVEINRLNNLISSLQQQLPQHYAELGKAYYELCSHDGGMPQLQQYVDTIQSAYADLDNYKSMVLKVKGIEQCPSCGAEIAAGASFCSNCGTKIVHEEAQPVGQTCPQCGAAVGENDLFCMSCGTSLKPSAPSQKLEDKPEIEEE